MSRIGLHIQCFSRLPLILLVAYPGFWAALWNVAIAEEKPVLELRKPLTGGGWSLLLHGQTGTNYTLEVSRSLNSWFALETASGTTGQIDFHYLPSTNSPPLFFRARTESPLPPVQLGVQLDTNLQSTTSLTADEGGSCSLTDGRGVTYTLVVPPHAVLDSQIVALIAATNLTGLPFAAGALGAVTVDPDSLQLFQAAQLIIQFPKWAPAPMGRTVSYAFNSAGGSLRLTPSLVESNSLSLPISGFSGFGCSVATVLEIQLQGRRTVADPTNTTAQVRTVGLQGSFYDSCYPAERTRSVFVGKGIENSQRQLGQKVAEKMAVNGQSPASDQLTIGDLNLEDDFNNFTQDLLDTYGEEMKSNCSLAQTVLSYIFGTERQAQLLGLSSDNSQKIDLCNGFSDCAKKIDDCCKTKGADIRGQLELINLSRQYQLMGCDTPDPFQYVQDCLPDWYGTVSFLDSYSSQTQGDGFESDQEYQLLSSLTSENLTGQPTGQGFFGVTGSLIGRAEGRFREHSHQDLRCDGYVDTMFLAAVQNPVTVTWQLVWALTNTPALPFPFTGYLMVPNLNDVATLANVKGPVVEIDAEPATNASGECEPAVSVRTSIRSMAFNLVIAQHNSSDIIGTINDVNGSYKTNWTSSDGTRYSRQVTWDLHHKQ